MSDLVKIYLWRGDCVDCGDDQPYFTEQPLSKVGTMRALSEKHARMVPADTVERWKAAEAAWDKVQGEIADRLDAS